MLMHKLAAQLVIDNRAPSNSPRRNADSKGIRAGMKKNLASCELTGIQTSVMHMAPKHYSAVRQAPKQHESEKSGKNQPSSGQTQQMISRNGKGKICNQIPP